ncbi:hypothetical protein CB1_000294044 [Camelus ferus]|nr:hypothetical protein CB1_000294044 [Camelus ferus]
MFAGQSEEGEVVRGCLTVGFRTKKVPESQCDLGEHLGEVFQLPSSSWMTGGDGSLLLWAPENPPWTQRAATWVEEEPENPPWTQRAAAWVEEESDAVTSPPRADVPAGCKFICVRLGGATLTGQGISTGAGSGTSPANGQSARQSSGRSQSQKHGRSVSISSYVWTPH